MNVLIEKFIVEALKQSAFTREGFNNTAKWYVSRVGGLEICVVYYEDRTRSVKMNDMVTHHTILEVADCVEGFEKIHEQVEILKLVFM